MSVIVKKNKTTFRLDVLDAHGSGVRSLNITEDTASDLLAGLQQALPPSPTPSLMEHQAELTKLCNEAIDEHTEQPIAQSPALTWVYSEFRGGNWCCGGGVYDGDRWACHNILVKYAPYVTTSMTIRLEMYDKPGPGRAVVTIHPEGPEDYQMELDNRRTDSYSELRDWIKAHKGHNRVYLGVQVVTDTPPCQERGPKAL